MPLHTTTNWNDGSVVAHDVPSQITSMLREGGRAQPALVQAAAEHLLQLGQLARYMSDADCTALRQHFPQATREWLQGLTTTVTQHQRLSGARLSGGVAPATRKKEPSRVRLPHIDAATPRELSELGVGALSQQPHPPSQPRSQHTSREPSQQQLQLAKSPRSQPAPRPRQVAATEVDLYVADMMRPGGGGGGVGTPQPPDGALLGAAPPLLLGGPGAFRPPAVELPTLPPYPDLKQLPLALVVQGREQVLAQLYALLNTVNRVRGAASRLPADVADGYRPRLVRRRAPRSSLSTGRSDPPTHCSLPPPSPPRPLRPPLSLTCRTPRHGTTTGPRRLRVSSRDDGARRARRALARARGRQPARAPLDQLAPLHVALAPPPRARAVHVADGREWHAAPPLLGDSSPRLR